MNKRQLFLNSNLKSRNSNLCTFILYFQQITKKLCNFNLSANLWLAGTVVGTRDFLLYAKPALHFDWLSFARFANQNDLLILLGREEIFSSICILIKIRETEQQNFSTSTIILMREFKNSLTDKQYLRYKLEIWWHEAEKNGSSKITYSSRDRAQYVEMFFDATLLLLCNCVFTRYLFTSQTSAAFFVNHILNYRCILR